MNYQMNYKKRRDDILKLDKKSVYVVFSNHDVTRSHDTEFAFRQDSNLSYLTGFNEPHSVLVLTSKDGKSHLFLRDSNPQEELWTGLRLGVSKAKDALKIDQTYDIKEFKTEISKLLIGHSDLYVDYTFHKEEYLELHEVLNSLAKMRKIKEGFPVSIHSLINFMGDRRLLKDEQEIQIMRKAAEISSQTHNNLMKMARPGMNEREVHGFIDYSFAKHGSAYCAYHHIVAGGNNANVLHYNNNNEALKDGDLLLVDAGCEFGVYASDITRTFPVNGKFTPAQKRIYELVLKVQKDSIARVKPGVTMHELHLASAKDLSLGLIELGLLKGSITDIMDKNLYKEFYPHGLGHWLGMDVHDTCPYYDDHRDDLKLAPGMVITIEPGLYLNSNNPNVPSEYKGIGIRIEDDVLVTPTGSDVLTKSCLKEVADIEKACADKITMPQI
jgi:Xaa-Pro aminopeptidase